MSTTGTAGTTGFDFVMYLVEDMNRARTFYQELFGLQPSATDSEYFVEYHLPDGGAFALARDPSADREPSGGAMFGVTDSEAAIARVEQLGGKLLRRYGGDICTSGWCADTEGNPFGVHQRKVTSTAKTETRRLRITGIDVHTYFVEDTTRALGFYKDALGLIPSMEWASGAEFELPDGSTFGIFNPDGRMPFVARAGVAFGVSDFDAAIRDVTERGAAVQMKFETPVCFMATIEDTEGNQITLHKRKTT